MAKKKKDKLIEAIFEEVKKGKMTEAFIDGGKDLWIEGLNEGQHIWVNPLHWTVETVVHECLHRMKPEWSENYVRRTTSYIINRMDDKEKKLFYRIYKKLVSRPKG